jgi:hypothetical protein
MKRAGICCTAAEGVENSLASCMIFRKVRNSLLTGVEIASRVSPLRLYPT